MQNHAISSPLAHFRPSEPQNPTLIRQRKARGKGEKEQKIALGLT
jgi:hypothetical protein